MTKNLPQNNMNLPAANPNDIAKLFEKATVQEQLAKALPSFLKADTLIRILITVIRQNAAIQKCSQQSLLACLFGCGQLGLTPEPWLGQAYLVPFWSSKLNCMEAVLIPGYRGLITLAKRSGEIVKVEAEPVFENDDFDYALGDGAFIKHKKAFKLPGEIIAAWTRWTYAPQFPGDAGEVSRAVMPIWKIDEIMERSKSRNKKGDLVGPWITDKPEMARKTVIRNHFKLAPVSVEKQSRFAQAVHAEDAALTVGPLEQRNLFLPEDTPTEIEGPDEDPTAEDFDSYFSEFSTDKKFDEFCNAAFTAGNYASIDELKLDVMKSNLAEAFQADFKKFKAKSKKPTKAKSKATPAAQKKKGAGKAASQAKAQQEPSGQDTRPEFDQLVESDLWQELSALKSQHPKHYKTVFGGKDPRTFAEAENGVDQIEFLAAGS